MDKLNIHIYTFCYNNAAILPFVIDYWKLYATKVIVYDNESTDRSVEILKQYDWIEVRTLSTNNIYDPDKILQIKNSCYKEARNTDVDYVMVCDLDEMLLYSEKLCNIVNARNKDIDVYKAEYLDVIRKDFPNYDGTLIQSYDKLFINNSSNRNKIALFKPSLNVEFLNYCQKYSIDETVKVDYLELLHIKMFGFDIYRTYQLEIISRLSKLYDPIIYSYGKDRSSIISVNNFKISQTYKSRVRLNKLVQLSKTDVNIEKVNDIWEDVKIEHKFSANKDIVIVIPVYKSTLSDDELLSIKQLISIVGKKYEIILVGPNDLYFDFYCNSINYDFGVLRCHPDFFKSLTTYSRLCEDWKFYNCFKEYKYMFLYQLDGWIFEDKLEFFADTNVDYIGSPWGPDMYDTKEISVGNGGISFRNIKKFLQVCKDITIEDKANKWYDLEDLFFCKHIAKKDPTFKLAAVDLAIQFSWDMSPDRWLLMTNGKLPMACHKWTKLHWGDYIPINKVELARQAEEKRRKEEAIAEAERKRKELEEQRRIQQEKEEAERKRKEAELKAKQEAERLAKQKLEEERKRREAEAQKIAKQKQLEERKKRALARQKAIKEEEERRDKEWQAQIEEIAAETRKEFEKQQKLREEQERLEDEQERLQQQKLIEKNQQRAKRRQELDEHKKAVQARKEEIKEKEKLEKMIYGAWDDTYDQLYGLSTPKKVEPKKEVANVVEEPKKAEIKQADSSQIKVALCAIAKNENRYIREWVEYYKELGIDKIFLYDNNDIDGERFEEVINDYMKSGFVEVIDYRGRVSNINTDRDGTTTQGYAYKECFEKQKNNYNWICFFDIDEFLEIVDNKVGGFKKFLTLDRFKDAEVIRVLWRMYGDNNQIYYKNESVLSRFKYDANMVEDNHFKSIVCSNAQIDIFCAHGPIDIKNTYVTCVGKKPHNKDEKYGIYWDCTYKGLPVYLNHFYSKSTQEFFTRKYMKTSAMYGKKSNRNFDANYLASTKKEEKYSYFGINNKCTKEKLDFIKMYMNTFECVDVYMASIWRSGHVIDSIKSLIYLSLVKTVTLSANNFTDELVKELTSKIHSPKLIIKRTNNEKASMEKLRFINEGNSKYIAFCDDDIIYSSNYFEKMIKEYETLNNPVSFHGSKFTSKLPLLHYYTLRTVYPFIKEVKNNELVDVIGNGVSLFKRDLLTPIEYISLYEDAPNISMDDITVSYILRKKGYKLYVVAHKQNEIYPKKEEKTDHSTFLQYKNNDTIQTNWVNTYYKNLS